MLYYWPGADHKLPSGGVRTHYDHVERLVEAGIPATILHVERGFRPPWFTSPAPVAYVPDVELGPSDTLVMNEILGPQTAHIAPGVRKVIFAQNCHYNFRGWPIPPQSPPPQTHPEVVATLVLTEYEREMFRWAFPDHPVYVTPHGYDFERFKPGPKRRQIAFMPRKHADEAQQVFGWLHAKGALEGWRVVAIDGASEDEAAQVMAESLVFVGFGYPEGGTKPPFEAAAAGCLVVSYGGFASYRDMNDCGIATISSGNSCQMARTLAMILPRGSEWIADQARAPMDAVRRRFTRHNERDAVVAAWRAIGV